MDESQFHKRIKHILASTKRGKYDSAPDKIHEAFHNDVLGKSGGTWDNEVAANEMKQIEWAFDVQPEVVQRAVSIQEPDVLKALSDFLVERGYEYTRIHEGKEKTPDGYIDGHSKRYIGEVKSPELKYDNKAGVYKFTSSHRQILNPIHTAVKQFDAVDPKHNQPHILIYTSAHPQLHWKVFTDAIQGGVIDQKGKRSPDLSGTHIYQATKSLIRKIDGYIWLQIGSNKKFHQASYFVNNSSRDKTLVSELFNNLHQKRLSSLGLDNLLEF